MRRSINPVGLFGALLSLSLLAAACGTTAPTAEGGAEPAEPAASADVAATDDSEASSEGDATARAGSFEAVFAAVDGLDWEARTERLLELTEAEGNTVSWYASMQVDMVDALVAGFEEQYGVDVKLYRASRDSVLRRIQEEAEAGYEGGADVVELTGAEISELARNDLLVPYDSEAEDGLVPTAIHDSWDAVRQTLLVPVWHTELVPEAEWPTSFTDFADERWRGKLQIDIQYAPWYKTAWEWLVEEEGYTPEEADALFETIVTDSIAIRPPSVALNLMGAGDFEGMLAAPSHSVDLFIADGSPVAYKPFTEPVIIEPNGNGLVGNAQNHAAAVLWQDWILTDGQEIIMEYGAPPARADLFAELGLEDVETLLVDVEEFIEVGDEWITRWTELARLAEHREAPAAP